MRRIGILLIYLVVMASCQTIQHQNQLINLASENGKYQVMIVYKDEAKQIVGIQRRGNQAVSYEVLGHESYLTHYYKFNGTEWEPCPTPPEAR